MTRPYSKDLRDRVVGSVAGGRSCRATAVIFGVSVASVVKWSQRWRATGSAAAKKMGGWRQLLLKSEREWLLARLASVEHPPDNLEYARSQASLLQSVCNQCQLGGDD
jgi:transposase